MKLQQNQPKMFPLSVLRSLYSPLCVCREPVLSLWPATQLMFGLLDEDMMTKDMERRMQRAHQAYQLLAQDMDRRDNLSRSSATTDKNISTTGKEGKENFELTLDISGFSPEELKVKTEGRRLIVSGKHDKKKEMENGGYFHEYKEWKREAELPQDVNPEDVVCSMSKDGQLRFLAPRLVLPAGEKRLIPITQVPGDGQLSPGDGQLSPGDGQLSPGDGQLSPGDPEQ
ncbi:heat shock protein 30C-like [Anomaloglossus baeobatrachus]|uniref:heat shock protein 30C-like n=1 Tax=Anomaloglossus baeobatrachus TaxID=238106 RepID=UPI003F4F7A1C